VEDCDPAAVEICSDCFSSANILMVRALCHNSTSSVQALEAEGWPAAFILCFFAMDARYCSVYCNKINLIDLYCSEYAVSPSRCRLKLGSKFLELSDILLEVLMN
jgi:hypothetical protein